MSKKQAGADGGRFFPLLRSQIPDPALPQASGSVDPSDYAVFIHDQWQKRFA